MEPRFGHDFSGVRIHSDSCAAKTSGLINARAFTIGENIGFAPGQYDPKSTLGRTLLAHELTHVVQQSSGNRSLLNNPSVTQVHREAKSEDSEEILEKVRKRKRRLIRWVRRMAKRVARRAKRSKTVIPTKRRMRLASQVVAFVNKGEIDLQEEVPGGISEELRTLLESLSQRTLTPVDISKSSKGEESESKTSDKDSEADSSVMFDERHFASAEAETAAEKLKSKFNVMAIAAGDTSFIWTTEEIGLLTRAFNLLPQQHLAILQDRIIAKVTAGNEPGLLGEWHCQSEGGKFALRVIQATFESDQNTGVHVLLHEAGHGVVCEEPALPGRFERFVRANRLATHEIILQVASRRFVEHAENHFIAGNPAEFFVEAYAVWIQDRGRLPTALAEWFDTNLQ